MTPPKIVGVIPARLESTRLPRKVLREIAGKPMIYWVYHNARLSPLLSELLVATDSIQVQECCRALAIPVLRTAQHRSGTDRVHEVMCATDGDVYANIQADEPMIGPDLMQLLLEPFVGSDVQVTTLKVAINEEASRDPNVVKVVTDDLGRALYFSRLPIPFARENGRVQRYKHLGMYAYRREALARFYSLTESSLEAAEKLEQLRCLQNGIPIHVFETTRDTIGVDTEDDLARVAELFSRGQSKPWLA
jgi:3-deoxy-manno-octulosonate cytidylyltransferase (CMP-KDO synthetase)